LSALPFLETCCIFSLLLAVAEEKAGVLA